MSIYFDNSFGHVIVENSVHSILVLSQKNGYLCRKRVYHSEQIRKAWVGYTQEQHTVYVLQVFLVERQLQINQAEHERNENGLYGHDFSLERVARRAEEASPHEPPELSERVGLVA